MRERKYVLAVKAIEDSQNPCAKVRRPKNEFLRNKVWVDPEVAWSFCEGLNTMLWVERIDSPIFYVVREAGEI